MPRSVVIELQVTNFVSGIFAFIHQSFVLVF